jgi:hypothetical protein
MFAVVSVDLERARGWIDVPEVAHAVARVDGHLSDPIQSRCRRRQDLADPIGSQLQVRSFGQSGETLAPPTCEVRDQDVISEVHLGLGQDPPAAGAPVTEMEWRPEGGADAHRCGGVSGPWARRGDQLSVDDLTDEIPRQVIEIFVSRGASSGIRHSLRLARRDHLKRVLRNGRIPHHCEAPTRVGTLTCHRPPGVIP